MGIFSNKKAMFDIICCNENNYLIWKWRPAGKGLGEDKREMAIRSGSVLRVREGEVAVFVYKQKDGSMQDYIVGPFDEKLKTSNFPVLSSIVGAFFGGDTPFPAEVYFINLSHLIQFKFAIPYFDVFDYRYADYGVPVAVRGSMSVKVNDYKVFTQIHRLEDISIESFADKLKDTVISFVKSRVASISAEQKIPVVQLERNILQVSNAIKAELEEYLKESYGVTISGFYLSALDIDKESDEYRELLAVTKNVTGATIEAQTVANIRNIDDAQRINAEHYEESLRVQREETQYAQHMKTKSENLSAYQIEKSTEVGVAGAEALGQMGQNGAGNIATGGAGGLNMVGLMTGMAIGGVVAGNVSNVMKNSINNIEECSNTPPPIPSVKYFVAINGKAEGPFEKTTISDMVTQGQITEETLVWAKGMQEWKKARDVKEIKSILDENCPPPMPI